MAVGAKTPGAMPATLRERRPGGAGDVREFYPIKTPSVWRLAGRSRNASAFTARMRAVSHAKHAIQPPARIA